jgi:hypothetical protein
MDRLETYGLGRGVNGIEMASIVDGMLDISVSPGENLSARLTSLANTLPSTHATSKYAVSKDSSVVGKDSLPS